MVHMLLSMDNMHGILRQLYTDMMTLCEGMTSVASGIAGLGALLYICYRVWQSLARGEAIDLFPLLRPFALGICIMFFPTLVLGSLNGILSPVVQATHSLMVGQTFNIEHYMEQREALEREERERLPADSYYAEDPEMERELDALGLDEQTRSTLDKMDEERSSWSFKGWLMKGLAYILELAFAAAAVVIDALRTFYLVVLSILGPWHSPSQSSTDSRARLPTGSPSTSRSTCGCRSRISSRPSSLVCKYSRSSRRRRAARPSR